MGIPFLLGAKRESVRILLLRLQDSVVNVCLHLCTKPYIFFNFLVVFMLIQRLFLHTPTSSSTEFQDKNI